VPPDDFSQYVATLGRGPGKSRALTREEARAAFGRVLAGEVDPHQLGAFLMLLRYRGEDVEEVTGIVEAMQATLPAVSGADLDWPSYGAGKTRDLPWFLLAALALGHAGVRVLMHGTNAFGTAVSVAAALNVLGRAPARDASDAAALLERTGFAYLPIETFAPEAARLLDLRRLFGLRSPVNTAARLLDPARAPAGVDGVFHPAYLDVHLGVAERLGRPRLVVLKGGGGEAERIPAKPGVAHVWDIKAGRGTVELPAMPLGHEAAGSHSAELFRQVWNGDLPHARGVGIVQATIGLALIALGRFGDAASAEAEAVRIWAARK
jgi:anthranilate phosphoribosyltransferase